MKKWNNGFKKKADKNAEAENGIPYAMTVLFNIHWLIHYPLNSWIRFIMNWDKPCIFAFTRDDNKCKTTMLDQFNNK